ncbi:hypothetical protein K1719_000934 [Acacia pycnantha]|nr:hypothetical protein K1719_000934 [Acacia pycnantha]
MPHSRKEVVLSEKDYQINKEGDVPSIVFSKDVQEVLVRGMERTMIIKLLGRSITYHDLLMRTRGLWQAKGSYQLVDMEGGFYMATFDLIEDYTKVLTGGPWMVFGAYLTVQPWKVDFDAQSSISNVVAWIRLPGLSFRYYHKSTLRAIGTLLGEVIKIDYMTETRGRGKFARLAVLIDLQKPLVPWIKVDGQTHGVEYEGLPLICFDCGKYGHVREKCSGKGQQVVVDGNMVVSNPRRDNYNSQSEQKLSVSEKKSSPETPSSQFGSWMQVKYSRKGNKHSGGKLPKVAGPNGTGGSRYNVLVNSDDLEEHSPEITTVSDGKIDTVTKIKDKAVGSRSQEQGPRVGKENSKSKSGPAHVVQVYRPKEQKGTPLLRTSQKPSMTEAPLSVSSKEGPTSDACAMSVINPADAIPPQIISKGPTQVLDEVTSSFKSVECKSTLDLKKHTVMAIQRIRPVLEEMAEPSPNNIIDQSVACMGTPSENIEGMTA